MEFLAYVFLFFLAWFALPKLAAAIKTGVTGDDGTRHCMTCGVEAKPKVVTKGSMGIEIILWLCFIVPGLIYSVWRLTSRHDACPSCGSTTLVPISSPSAVTHTEATSQKRCPECAEVVQALAKVCKHCSFKFPEVAPRTPESEPSPFTKMSRR